MQGYRRTVGKLAVAVVVATIALSAVPLPVAADGDPDSFDGARLESPRDLDGDGLYEDVDGDGQFSVLDVAWLLEAFDGDGAWVTTVPERADANGDGRLDVLDVAALLEEL